MAAGIQEIAAAAGVSVSTVSNALNSRPNIGESTRKRVMQLCKEMGYAPHAGGKNPKTGTSKTILFNFSDFGRSYYLKIIEGINDYAQAKGYDLMICTAESCEKYMKNRLTDGCIILNSLMENEALIRAAREGYPIVVLDRVLQNPYIKSVIVDNYKSMSSLMKKIVERGYRDFAFISGQEYTDDTKERFQAFLDVLAANGISFSQDRYFSGNYKDESGYRGAKIFMMSHKLPEIIVCANDDMALGALRALTENGLRVPEDVAVTGFDNIDEGKNAGLTTVTIPGYERGYMAAHSLIENIAGGGNTETFRIPASVMWRNTVCAKT